MSARAVLADLGEHGELRQRLRARVVEEREVPELRADRHALKLRAQGVGHLRTESAESTGGAGGAVLRWDSGRCG